MDAISLAIVAGALASIAALAAFQVARRRARERRDEATLRDKVARGAHLARSLHPVINPDVCIGSLSCLKACPEGDILGIIGGAARLIHADHCIGHGRCAAECPVGAIRLVFGSAERGVDLPEVDAASSRRGGGPRRRRAGRDGAHQNAITQGLQVAEHLAELCRDAGRRWRWSAPAPRGSRPRSASRAPRPLPPARAGQIGGSVAHYPAQELTMTEPVDLPI